MRIAGKFTSNYLRKEKRFKVEMKDRFGRITIARCSKIERNEMRKQFDFIQNEKKVSTVIAEKVVAKKIVKKKIVKKNLLDEIKDTDYYVVDNFTANLFSEEGKQINLPYGNDFIETLELGKFVLMPRWYEKKLNLDERISY